MKYIHFFKYNSNCKKKLSSRIRAITRKQIVLTVSHIELGEIDKRRIEKDKESNISILKSIKFVDYK